MKSKFLTIGAVMAGLILTVAALALGGFIDPASTAQAVGTILGGGSVAGLGLTMGGGPAPGGQQRQLLPFRENTRQKFGQVGSFAYSLGANSYLTLPKVGYCSKIFVSLDGLITATNAGADTITYAKFGPWSLFRNINFNLNSGKQTLVDLSGYELFLHNSVTKKSARIDQNADADYYAAPTTGSAQPFNLTLEIPVSVSDGQNFAVGLVNLQAPEIQANLQVSFASALTDIGTNISAITGTVYVNYEYYEVPDPSQVMQPPAVLHKLISQPQAVLSTGVNIVEIPRGGDLLRVIQILELNGAKSDSYDNLQIWLNKTQQIAQLDRWNTKFMARRRYGFNLPTGCSIWDFQQGWDIDEESDLRDALDTEAVTTTEFKHVVTSGATLGSNNNFIHTLREFIQIPVA